MRTVHCRGICARWCGRRCCASPSFWRSSKATLLPTAVWRRPSRGCPRFPTVWSRCSPAAIRLRPRQASARRCCARSAEPKQPGGAPLRAWSLAAVALFAGAAVLACAFWFWGLLGTPAGDGEGAGLVSAAQLQRVLERTESNAATSLAVLKPIGTFLSTENEWCRQYQLVGDQ